MKKPLLLIGALALSALSAMADVTTLTFDGTNDMYGLTRQMTATPTSYVKEWSFTQDGIDVKFEDTNTNAAAMGFGLVKGPNTNAGLYTYGAFQTANSASPKITLTVPGGKISKVVIAISGTSTGTMPVTINGTSNDDPTMIESNYYSWSWTNATGVETVEISYKGTFYARYIHSIEVTYTQDLGGKAESGLAFSTDTAEGVIGEAFTVPTLANPNNLPITWTSSEPSVATVDANGAVTLVKGGTTVITAATVGNDSFAAGNAKYTLAVIPAANNLKQMQELAPAVNDRVMVKCPLTVTYASGARAYVIDAQGNASRIYDQRNEGSTSSGSSTTIYSVGQVISADWIATNAAEYEQALWSDLPTASGETVEVVYPEVETVSPADVNRVLVLKNVTFDGTSPAPESKKFATLANGDAIEVQNSYNAAVVQAGTYDMTCIVHYSKRSSTVYFYVSPIAYVEVVNDPVFPSSVGVSADQEGVTIYQEPDDENEGSIMMTVSGEIEADQTTLTFEVPEGWAGYCFIDMSVAESARKKAKSEWPDLATFEQMYVGLEVIKGNTLTIDADGENHLYHAFLYTEDNYVDVEHFILLGANITKVVEPEFPATFDITVNPSTGVTINQGYDDDVELYMIKVEGKITVDKAVLTFNLPEGWEGIVASDLSYGGMARRKAMSEWRPLDEYDGEGVTTGTTLSLEADGETHTYSILLYTPDHLVNEEKPVILMSKIEKTNTGINAIEIETAPARFYNMQGIEVEHPVNGAFIKVQNGKATKVTVK